MKQIFVEKFVGSEETSQSEIDDNLVVQLPRATAEDKGIKKISCEGKLVVGQRYELPISYESQLDDNNQHIVFVAGIPRGHFLGASNSFVEAIRASRAASKGQASSISTPNSSETTVIIGTINSGTLLSSVISDDGSEYTFPTQSEMANSIFEECQADDMCIVSGHIKDGSILSVVNVTKL
ncbi:hypothetical protein [Panacagrimonas sp.]|uniref:hypothetical protein n=1 Tax=Panacagrimonas sp. TaxID=2480088 RepID=UPI003B528DF8